MAMDGVFLFLASFLGTGVEMVEALTIVLATGLTRGWRSTLIGMAAASAILLVIVAVFGTALATLGPLLPALRVVVGTFLLIFGLQWLRKAILRYGGLQAVHDEEKIFARNVQELSKAGSTRGTMDWAGFTVAFKGVLLEGLEAVFIVITFGSAAVNSSLFGFSGVALAALAGLLALAIVVVVGLLVHRPLSAVPENTMKFAVGLMLVSFGTFWSGEGLGVNWAPLEDAWILLLLAFYAVVSWGLVSFLQRSQQRRALDQGVRV